MNALNRKPRKSLPACPQCGMDSGERMQSEAAPFKYYVRCATCGAVTAGYAKLESATKAWQRGDAWK